MQIHAVDQVSIAVLVPAQGAQVPEYFDTGPDRRRLSSSR
jgi:hypothetical protein